MSGTAAPLLAALLFSLIFSSSAIAYFATEMQIGETIPTIDFKIGIDSYSQNQNFKTGSYDVNTFKQIGSAQWFVEPNIGMMLHANPDYLIVDNIMPDSNGIITNTYIINNSAATDYRIIPYYSGGTDQIEILVSSDGFYITRFGSKLFKYDFIPYVWANKFTHPQITTTYNNKLHTLDFTLNSASFHTNKIPAEDINPLGLFMRKYGGVYSDTIGFTLESFTTSNPINGNTNENTNGLLATASFVKNMLAVLLWTLPESVFPLLLNLILIKTQLAVFVVGLAQFIRGG